MVSVTPTDEALRELLALWSGPAIVMAEGRLIRSVVEEVLSLRAIAARAREVVSGPVPGALRALELLAHEIAHQDAEMEMAMQGIAT